MDQLWPNAKVQQTMLSGLQEIFSGQSTPDKVLAAMDADYKAGVLTPAPPAAARGRRAGLGRRSERRHTVADDVTGPGRECSMSTPGIQCACSQGWGCR